MFLHIRLIDNTAYFFFFFKSCELLWFFELLLYLQRARVMNSLCRFPTSSAAGIWGRWRHVPLILVSEQEGKGRVWIRHFVGECGDAAAEGKSKLDERAGARLLGSVGEGLWYVGLAGCSDRESSLWHGNRHRTRKEEGTGTRRQGRPKVGWQEAEEMGSSSSVSRSSRYIPGLSRACRHPGSRREPESPKLWDSLPRDLGGQKEPWNGSSHASAR